MSQDLRARVKLQAPALRPPGLSARTAGGLLAGFALALLAAWIVPGLRGTPPMETSGGSVPVVSGPGASFAETSTFFTLSPAEAADAIRLDPDATNPFPPMRGSWTGATDQRRAIGVEAARLFEAHRFADLETLYARLAQPDAVLSTGEPATEAFFAPFLDPDSPSSLAARKRDADAYLNIFPSSPAAALIAASVRLQAMRDASSAEGSGREAVRRLVDFLEVHREPLRADPASHVLWIELLAQERAFGSVRTELEDSAREAPGSLAPFLATTRYMTPDRGWSPEALGDAAALALKHAPETDALALYARVNLTLAQVYPSRLYTDTRLDRDRFHAGLIQHLATHPDPATYSLAARVACENRDLHLARLLIHRLQVVPAALIDWDDLPGSEAYPSCRRQIVKTYGRPSQAAPVSAG